jgi:hypothetical protein
MPRAYIICRQLCEGGIWVLRNLNHKIKILLDLLNKGRVWDQGIIFIIAIIFIQHRSNA